MRNSAICSTFWKRFQFERALDGVIARCFVLFYRNWTSTSANGMSGETLLSVSGPSSSSKDNQIKPHQNPGLSALTWEVDSPLWENFISHALLRFRVRLYCLGCSHASPLSAETVHVPALRTVASGLIVYPSRREFGLGRIVARESFV